MRAGLALLLTASVVSAQEAVERRLDRLEAENRDLRARVAGLEAAPAAVPHQGDNPLAGPPGFQKAYSIEEGVSLAGYGEYLWTQRSGQTDVADALRTVLYFGYRFDERWLFHSEIELEHGSTSETSGTTSSGGEVSLEFGYLEYRVCDSLSLRGGMVLVPVGLVNELHEPTMFLPAARAQTETRIIPTTWRELGLAAVATLGDVDLRAFVGTGLDGEEFGPAGVRSGRQKGNRAAADDVLVALRGDLRPLDGLTVGASAAFQRAGQDGLRGTTPIPEMDTGILAGHADYRVGPWSLRALYATVLSDDAGEFARATGRNLARRSQGYYAEVGCDVLAWLCPESAAALTPFVRYERIDTQAWMPGGIAGDRRQDDEIVTFGVALKPIDRIVIKLDFENWDHDSDRMNVAVGYVF